MVELHNVRTFNANTGFKAGYLNKLERMLEKVLPHAMLKDEHRQMVVAEDVWNPYISSHKETGQFRHRSFLYYDQLTSIYKKNRATGKDAQPATDIVEEMDAEDVATTKNPEEGSTYHGCEVDVSLDEMDVSAT
ncbi:hypothetical protein Goklo_008532 [Gossypium klotzschianum]|uniref:Myb/SANT-like domain-containing protein n=1 Tax=Gossypium klotzschianum TaxID=34286 RepID=A0A7J8V018_9ROSI|nr:hypothetical protein [Gossypium klotzschianum]